MKVGDIITAYSPGYHIVTGCSSHGSGIRFNTIINGKGKILTKLKINSCHRSWCKVVDIDEMFVADIKAAEDKRDYLKLAQAQAQSKL